MNKAVVIIPTYNERENIPRTVAALLKVFDQIKDWQMEMLVVDDSSPDKTAEVVRDLGKKESKVHLLVNPQKAGLGGAYLKGMEKAFGPMKADVVFEFDADLSHDPTRIPAFLDKIDEGYDLVLGSRYIPGGGIPANWGWHRKFMSIVGNTIVMVVLTDFHIKDWTTGYRALTKKVYDAVQKEMHDQRFTGYTFQMGFLHKTIRHGFKVAEVPFQFVDRTIGYSKLGPEYFINPLIFIFKTRFQELAATRIFKFVMVGGIGATTQLIMLQLFWLFFPYQIAFFLAIEMAVLTNFILSNLWTFSDRKLELSRMPAKFLQFNVASSGSIIIQQIVAAGGEFFIGLRTLFETPIIHFKVNTGTVFAVVGILIGMFWNYFAYNTFIWRKSK